MAKLIWMLVGIGLALPIIAGFTFVPISAEPQVVGDYFSGVIQYRGDVISQIRWS